MWEAQIWGCISLVILSTLIRSNKSLGVLSPPRPGTASSSAAKFHKFISGHINIWCFSQSLSSVSQVIEHIPAFKGEEPSSCHRSALSSRTKISWGEKQNVLFDRWNVMDDTALQARCALQAHCRGCEPHPPTAGKERATSVQLLTPWWCSSFGSMFESSPSRKAAPSNREGKAAATLKLLFLTWMLTS